MGLFDSLKNMFAHHEHHHGGGIGQPLTLADAKAVLAFIVVHQQLADMRKVADAVKQLQDEMPQYITFGMSHYYSEPKRVRFQSEGGKFIDADAIATAFAETTVLQDECEIQHLMGDIEDNREHRDPAKTPAVPIDELVRVTDERLATGNDEEQTMRSKVVHGCSPYSISSMTLPRRQRTTWSRLSQRWIRLYKTAPLLLATPPLPTLATAATMPMPAMHVPVSSP